MIKPKRHPYGYKNLLVYKKAEELQKATAEFTSQFPKTRTLTALADQKNRSARSTKQNIVEGWKRNSTKEYYQFLGYSVASNAELEEDFNDIINGMYNELLGKRGLMGEMGLNEVEKIPFYPLKAHLSPVVALKLRAKELNFLLDRLQQSLVDKMRQEGTLSIADKLAIRHTKTQEAEQWYKDMLKQSGLVRLENGRVVKKEEWKKNKDKWVLWNED